MSLVGNHEVVHYLICETEFRIWVLLSFGLRRRLISRLKGFGLLIITHILDNLVACFIFWLDAFLYDLEQEDEQDRRCGHDHEDVAKELDELKVAARVVGVLHREDWTVCAR